MTNRFSRTGAFFIMGALLFLLAGCRERDRNLEEKANASDSLRQLLEQERETSDSLRNLLNRQSNPCGNVVHYGKEFEGVEDPEEFVRSSLREQPEKIPLDPVLGGAMDFREITVLTDKWVMALYDDGHIQGRSLYEYELLPGDSIHFKRIASHHPS